jgi:DNA (cytosine-5)-methyltransferase 1
MTHGSLFSGIGGFDLAAEWMGWENIFHCEWNSFGQKVLKYHFPNAISYEDITKTDFTIHRGRIDLITGGFPCQPYSTAGKRLGKEDERHLWPEMLRAIREIQPRWVVGENVLGLVNWSGGLVFHEVQADLEAEGYEVQPYVLPACAVNAPHRRDRVWFVAKNTKCNGFVFGEPNQEGAEIRQFGNTCTGSSVGIHLSERSASNPTGNGYDAKPTPANNSIGQNNKQSRTQRKRTIEGLSDERPTPHPNRNGLNQRNGNDEEQSGEGGEYAQRNPLPSNGNGDATDTESKRLQGQCRKRKRCSEHRSNEGIFIWSESKFNAADTNGIRLRGESNGIGKSRFTNEAGEIGNWHNFPTQSPICTGDDGLSSRLDGITFSKWRNESIKAGGNAIVPQVIYQIFKAIEQYEKG